MKNRLHKALRLYERPELRVELAKLDVAFACSVSRILSETERAKRGRVPTRGVRLPQPMLDLANEAYDVLTEENVPTQEWGA